MVHDTLSILATLERQAASQSVCSHQKNFHSRALRGRDTVDAFWRLLAANETSE